MSYFGVLATLLFGVFIVVLSNAVPVQRVPATTTHTASSTLSVVPSITIPSITLPSLEPKSPTTTDSVQLLPTPKKVIRFSSSTATTSAQPVAAPLPPILFNSTELDASASALRAALVNIICYVPAASGLRSISGSGVIIDPKGIILTNAHIAQYFLLTDRGARCTIRSGSPAKDSYNAALIYISPAWLRANTKVITQAAPSGTGEYDFALLAITKSATTDALPSSFPSIALATLPPNTNTPIVIATYGAQFLESNQIQSALFPTVVFGSVKTIFTFKTNTIDVLALGGSAAAQEGSSGGGVANANRELVGTITTSTTEGATATRSLSAITASYIRAEYASETGQALDLLLAKPTVTAVAEFAPQISTLEAIITANLP